MKTDVRAAACYDCFSIGTRGIKKMSQKIKCLGIRGFLPPPFIITYFPFCPCTALEDTQETFKNPCQLFNASYGNTKCTLNMQGRFYDLRLIEFIKDFANFTLYLWSGL